jgi:hypothetical protein
MRLFFDGEKTVLKYRLRRTPQFLPSYRLDCKWHLSGLSNLANGHESLSYSTAFCILQFDLYYDLSMLPRALSTRL